MSRQSIFCHVALIYAAPFLASTAIDMKVRCENARMPVITDQNYQLNSREIAGKTARCVYFFPKEITLQLTVLGRLMQDYCYHRGRTRMIMFIILIIPARKRIGFLTPRSSHPTCFFSSAAQHRSHMLSWICLGFPSPSPPCGRAG